MGFSKNKNSQATLAILIDAVFNGKDVLLGRHLEFPIRSPDGAFRLFETFCQVDNSCPESQKRF